VCLCVRAFGLFLTFPMRLTSMSSVAYHTKGRIISSKNFVIFLQERNYAIWGKKMLLGQERGCTEGTEQTEWVGSFSSRFNVNMFDHKDESCIMLPGPSGLRMKRVETTERAACSIFGWRVSIPSRAVRILQTLRPAFSIRCGHATSVKLDLT
jgi:hypothetical protein